MESATHLAILMAIAVGFVSAGLIASIWSLWTGSPPDTKMLESEDLLTPVRTIAVVSTAPWLLIHASFWWFIVYPPLGIPFLLAAIGWSFLQGVFILTQIFGLS